MIIQNKKFRLLLGFALLFLVNYRGNAQLTLSQPVSGSHEYVDPVQIRLVPGFNYGATDSDKFIGKIGEYANHKVLLGSMIGKEPLSTGGIVGAIPGAAGVSPMAGATYTIPIEVPPGIKGMQPNISINYNSHAGNSMLGLGMSLGGLSVITRSPDNPYYDDGNYHAVDFSENDKLSLDGQRLLVTSGVYGSTNSSYTTENDPNTRINLHSSDLWATASSYFSVHTKSGVTMYYGNTDDSKLILSTQTNPLIWYINRMEDANGNYMTYNYITIDDEKLISSIEYTGNGSQAPFYKIQFNYIERVDANFAFVGGAKLEQKHLLDNIEIQYNNSMLKRYSFSYEYDISARMTGVSLENADGEYLNPTIFEWEEKVGTDTEQTSINCVNGAAGDFNGDGLSDFLAVVKEGDKIYERLYRNDNGTLVYTGTSQEVTFKHRLFENVLDFNGDGKADILDRDIVSVQNEMNFWTHYHRPIIGLSTNSNTFEYLYANRYQEDFKPAIGDFDGDGLDDAFLLYSNGSAKLLRYNDGEIEQVEFDENGLWNANPSFFSDLDKLYTGDYNADGRLDIGYIDENDRFKCFMILTDTWILEEITLPDIPKNGSIQTADFNGDGLTDVADISGNSVKVYFLKGNELSYNFFSSPYIPLAEYNAELPENWQCNEYLMFFHPFVSDINADGKADIAYTLKKKYIFSKSDGSAFTNEDLTFFLYTDVNGGENNTALGTYTWQAPCKVYIGYGRGDGTFEYLKEPLTSSYDLRWLNLLFADFNGDGIGDIYAKGDNEFSIISNDLNSRAFQLKTATDGLDNSVQFEYKSLNDPTDPEFYYTSSGPDYFPVRTIRGSLMAVEQITYSNAASNDIVEKYSYQDGRVHVLGKGFLGFSRINKENVTLGITDYSSYSINLDYFKNELIFKQKYLTDTYTTLETQYFEGTFVPFGGKRYMYKLDTKINTDYLNNNTTTIDYNFDSYGNLQSETVTTEDATVLTSNSYVPRGSNLPNKIETTTTTHTRGADVKSRTKEYLWDNDGNLTKETIDPGDENELVTDYQDYDDFGNPETVSVTANGSTITETFTYENGRMLKTSTNSLDQTTTFTNNLIWGNVSYITDFKNRTTSYAYDGWGRQTGISYPDNIEVTASMDWANGTGPTGAVYYNYKETSGSAPEYIWFDKKGRKLRVETTGFNTQQVYIDTEYDDWGRVHTVSEPYYEGGAKNVTTTTYDDFHRVATKTLPTGEVITSTYNENEINVTGPNTDITKVMNSLGEVISTTDNIGNESVSYQYYANGLLKSSLPSTGTAVTMDYDTQGNRTKMIDPDAGTITSKYNGFGKLIWQEDNKGNRTTNYFDAQGRLDYIERSNAATIDYIYDTDSRLSSITDGVHSIGYEYDDFDRITKTTENIDSRDFVFEVVLDDFGRVENEIYPSGYTLTNVYDNAGILTEITDQNNTRIWKADIVNALGQFEQVTKGNEGSAVSTVYGYDAHHRLTSITAGSIIDFSYEFDPLKGNLDWRKDELQGVQGIREDFDYDELNRLKWAKYDGQETNYLDIAYEANGNIQSKTDAASNYIYDATQSHAVSTLEGYKNINDENPQNIIYNHFNKISNITEGSYEMNFTYGVDEYQRKTELFNNAQISKTKYLLGNYELELDAANNERKIHYIAGGDGLAAIYIEEPGTVAGEGDLYYAYADHLGSLVALQNENGNIQRQSFDPWGRRRNVSDWLYNAPEKIDIVDIGYTGHEHLDEFGIINMTGRLYDPVVARMLSPDPQLQAPGFAQNFNRYSYCFNNPLKYVDPDGENPLLIGAIMGAFFNTAMQQFNGNINNVGDFFLSAGIGGLSGLAGAWASSITPGIGFAGGFINGFAGGFSSSFIAGAGNAWMNGSGLSSGLEQGGKAGFTAGLMGGGLSGILGGIYAKNHGGNFWTGADAIFEATINSSSLQIEYTVGDGMEYSNEWAKKFSDKWFGERDGLNGLYADGTLPPPDKFNKYFKVGDAVINEKTMQEVAGLTRYLGGGKSDVYLYKAIFVAKPKLYLFMGHEYMHVAYNRLGVGRTFAPMRAQHASIYKWKAIQAAKFNYYFKESYGKYLLLKDFTRPRFDYKNIGFKIIPNPW